LAKPRPAPASQPCPPAWIEQWARADQLAQAYQKLRVEVLDRTDRAIWEMLQQNYGFVQQVDSSAQKRETRNELIQ